MPRLAELFGYSSEESFRANGTYDKRIQAALEIVQAVEDKIKADLDR